MFGPSTPTRPDNPIASASSGASTRGQPSGRADGDILNLSGAVVRLFDEHPRAREIALALSAYLTHAIPFAPPNSTRAVKRSAERQEENSLLTHALALGVRSWAAREGSLVDFLAGTFYHLPRVALWQVYVSRRRSAQAWDFSRGPLTEWVRANGGEPFVVPRPPYVEPSLGSVAIRSVIAARVLNPDDLARLDFSLESIVADRPLA